MGNGEKKFDDLAEKIVSSFKSSLEKQTKLQIPDVGKYLSQNVAGGLVKNDKLVVEAFNAMLEKLKYQREFDIINEAEYYRQLERLRDRYFSYGTKNWVKYTEEIYSYQKKTLETEKENITKLYGEVADYAEERINDVVKRQQKAAEKINDFGGLFNTNTVHIGDETDVYYTLHNLEHDIEIIRRYGEGIKEIEARLSELGVSGEASNGIFDAIKEFDFEDGYSFIRALLTSSDTELTSFAENLQLKKALAEGISADQYEDEFAKGLNDAINNMKRKLADAGYEIPEGFVLSGSLSAQKFGEAFLEGLETQLDAIRTRIEEFNNSLSIDLNAPAAQTTYNTTNTSYNIQSPDSSDTVEQIKRYEAVKRLSGVN